jgi:hypothetical protein
VTKWGLVYALAQVDDITYLSKDEDMYVGADNAYVASMESTEKGTLDSVMGESQTATYFVRTMLFSLFTAKEFCAKYKVRAYALLEDGNYVYSEVHSYTVYDICDTLYQNVSSNTYEAHNYLYNSILHVVNPDYKEVDYKWENTLAKDTEVQ